MNCPYCKEFRGNPKLGGYTVRMQLKAHIEIKHLDKKEQAEQEWEAHTLSSDLWGEYLSSELKD